MEESQIKNRPRGRSRLKPAPEKSKKGRLKTKKTPWLKRFAWPKLALAVFFLGLSVYLMISYHPDQLRNIVINNSFLPLSLSLSLSIYFFASGFKLQSELSWTIALSLTLMLWLSWQNLSFNFWIVILIFIPSIFYLIFEQIKIRLL